MPSAVYNNSKKYIFPLLLYLGVMFHHFSWNWQNHSYPQDDAGDYAQVAQEIAIVARQNGVTEALRFAYFHRHWKPVLGQHLLAPFISFSEGDVRTAFRVYSFALSLFFVFGIYLVLVRLLASRSAAFLAAILFNLTPWMLFNHQNFGAELPWLAFCAWGFLFYLQSEEFNRTREAVLCAVFLSLALMCRPVETSVLLLLPFAFEIFRPLQGRREVIIHAGVIALEAALLMGVALWPYSGTANLSVTGEVRLVHQIAIAAAWVLYSAGKLFYLRRTGRARALRVHGLWTLTMTLVFLWYLPTFRTLWSWVTQTSSGPMVREAGGYALIGQVFLKLFFLSSGLLIFVPCLFFRRPTKKAAAFVLWAGFALAAVGALTDSRDFRYYQLSWMVLFFFGVWSLAGRGRPEKWRLKAQGLLLLLIALQAYGTLPRHYADRPEEWARLPLISSLGWLAGEAAGPRPRTPDTEFERLLDEIIAERAPNNSEFIIIDAQNPRGWRPLTNPWKFVLRAREQGHLWNFRSYLRRYDGRTTDADFIAQAKGLADYLLVGPPAGPDSPSPQENVLAGALFACAGRGDCARFGVTAVRKIEIPGEGALTFLLFRVERPERRPSAQLECYQGMDEVIR